MLMGWIWTGLLLISLCFAAAMGNMAALSASVISGAQAGVTLAISIAGAICLWSGVGRLMERIGLTDRLARLLQPLLGRLFPATKTDLSLRRDLSANVCANLLGLGNAATPMGIRAAKRMIDPARPQYATDAMCRLIVMNTASIQLIPANVAAVRAGLGAAAPFDILPAVWVTSLCSVAVGLTAANLFGKLWRHD